MRKHTTTIRPDCFNAILEGRLSCIVRKNKKNFEIGDTLTLKEYDHNAKITTGRPKEVLILYVISRWNSFCDAIAEDSCILSFRLMRN